MLSGGGEHLLVAGLVGGEPASAQNLFVGVNDLDGG
jgi:hypothetical protein